MCLGPDTSPLLLGPRGPLQQSLCHCGIEATGYEDPQSGAVVAGGAAMRSRASSPPTREGRSEFVTSIHQLNLLYHKILHACSASYAVRCG